MITLVFVDCELKLTCFVHIKRRTHTLTPVASRVWANKQQHSTCSVWLWWAGIMETIINDEHRAIDDSWVNISFDVDVRSRTTRTEWTANIAPLVCYFYFVIPSMIVDRCDNERNAHAASRTFPMKRIVRRWTSLNWTVAVASSPQLNSFSFRTAQMRQRLCELRGPKRTIFINRKIASELDFIASLRTVIRRKPLLNRWYDNIKIRERMEMAWRRQVISV